MPINTLCYPFIVVYKKIGVVYIRNDNLFWPIQKMYNLEFIFYQRSDYAISSCRIRFGLYTLTKMYYTVKRWDFQCELAHPLCSDLSFKNIFLVLFFFLYVAFHENGNQHTQFCEVIALPISDWRLICNCKNNFLMKPTPDCVFPTNFYTDQDNFSRLWQNIHYSSCEMRVKFIRSFQATSYAKTDTLEATPLAATEILLMSYIEG